MKKRNIFLILVLLVVAVGFLIPVGGVYAKVITLMDQVSSTCKSSGDCSVCDVLRVIYNVARFIFASMSAIALIIMLWAGTGFIFNWGNAEMIAANKKMIFHTFLALLIILAAHALIGILIGLFLHADGIWNSGEWYKGPSCGP